MEVALYDPNEFPAEIKTGADFTLGDVLAWARTKDAGEVYNYTDQNNCAVAQFGRATGRPHLAKLSWSGSINKLCPGLGDAAVGEPETFGAFADRLEAAIAR